MTGRALSAGRHRRAIEPEAILSALLALDLHLRCQHYYGGRATFYNPGGVAPLGVIFASIKDRDGPNDRRAHLSRPGVYRFAFGVAPSTFEQLFGEVPARPPKGEAIALSGHDLTRLDQLTPHPVYAWMSWIQILAPTAPRFESLRPLLTESLDLVRAKWKRRAVA
jgi:Family of unknown function (DUF6194)